MPGSDTYLNKAAAFSNMTEKEVFVFEKKNMQLQEL